MQLTGLDNLLWLAGFVVHVALLTVILSKRRTQQFPVFAVWIGFLVLKTCTLFSFRRYGSEFGYYYAYLALTGVDILVQVAVTYEIAVHVFRPAGRWERGVKTASAVLGCIALVVSTTLSWIALPPTDYFADTLLIRGQFFSATLISELFVGMVVLSVRYGLPQRTHVAQIARGLGAFSLACVVIELLHTIVGIGANPHTFHVISRGRSGVYLLAALYWTKSLAIEAPAEQRMPEQMRRELLRLQQRTRYLVSVLQGVRQV